MTLISALQNQTVIIFPLSGVAASAQVLIDGLKYTTADAALLVPFMVAEIAKNLAHLDFVSRNLERIFYGGGDVSQTVGDMLVSEVKFSTMYGSTETAVLPILEERVSWSAED